MLVIKNINDVNFVLVKYLKYIYCLKYYFFIMYLFAVIGFFAAFLAFMKFGSNDFGISSGKEQPKGPKTF